MTDSSHSRWLDVHRPRTGELPTAEAEGDSSGTGTATDEEKPWDGVDAAGRSSETDVDLPSPNVSADD